MAVVVAGQLVGTIVGVSQDVPTDVESDSSAPTLATLNVQINRAGGAGGFLTIDVDSSVIATLADGACTVTISQGAGTLDTSVAQ